MCTEQLTASTLRGWLRDPMIRLVMASDGVSEQDMITLVERVSVAVSTRLTTPVASQWRPQECSGAW